MGSPHVWSETCGKEIRDMHWNGYRENTAVLPRQNRVNMDKRRLNTARMRINYAVTPQTSGQRNNALTADIVLSSAKIVVMFWEYGQKQWDG